MNLMRIFVSISLFATFALPLSCLHAAPSVPVYKNPKVSLEARVADLFSRLTEKEKLTLLTGTGYTSQPIPELKLAGINMADAGQGVRGGDSTTQGPATAFPCGLVMASSWDPSLLWSVGHAIGEEAKNKGKGIQMELAPGVNIQRSPLNGRTSEYLGEDPYLTAHLDVPFIEGVQSTGIAACVKHFAANNEEGDRTTVNVHVSERALREIYLPAFEAAVTQAHVDAIMASYNRINGPYASADWYTLHAVLREAWGYQGLALSDWGAVHETAGPVNAGLDLEMPGPGMLTSQNLQAALNGGSIRQSDIDTAVKHILRTMILCGLVDPVQHVPDHRVVGSIAHQNLAYHAALEGAVLLKNDNNQLPLNSASIKSVAIIGIRAKQWQMNTGGSPFVTPTVSVSAYDGIVHRLGAHSRVSVYYAAAVPNIVTDIPASDLTTVSGKSGLAGVYFNNVHLTGKPSAARIDKVIDFDFTTQTRPDGIPEDNFSARWVGMLRAPQTGLYTISLASDDGGRLWIGGKLVIDHWVIGGMQPAALGHIHLLAGHKYPVRLEYFQAGGYAGIDLGWQLPTDANKMFSSAEAIAKKASVAIVVAGTDFEQEGTDRASMALPDLQDMLIERVASLNPHTIVVLNNGGPVLMHPWIGRVPAVLEMGFPGEYGGKALASLLFGDVNPSGKLAETDAVRRQDYPDYPNFPGTNDQVNYAEGIYVGYRAFDKRDIVPEFPFGYGLSYTKFNYSNITISSPQSNSFYPLVVSADITNVGTREGTEIAELYIEPISPMIDRPIRELKGFARVDLLQGETKTVHFTLYPRDFAYCDVSGKQWRADSGQYIVEVAASSRDIRLHMPFYLTALWTQSIPWLGDTDPYQPPPSFATGKPAAASSTMHDNLAAYAFDAQPGSRWESHWCSPQWISVDLGQLQTFSRVTLSWDSAYASAYKIQASDDNKSWRTVYASTHGNGGKERIHFRPTSARYVRLLGLRRATAYGYSLYSFDVY